MARWHKVLNTKSPKSRILEFSLLIMMITLKDIVFHLGNLEVEEAFNGNSTLAVGRSVELQRVSPSQQMESTKVVPLKE